MSQNVKDLTRRLFSRDPIEYNSAINQYLEPSASYTSGLIKLQGSSRIKKVWLVESWFVKEKKVDGEKQGKGKKSGSGLEGWDESSQTLIIPVHTTYTTPFPLPLISLSFTFPSTLTLHLRPTSETNTEQDGTDDIEDAGIYSDDGEGEDQEGLELMDKSEEGKRYLVAKMVERGLVDKVLGDGKAGFTGFIHSSILRPLFTLLILTLATLTLFHKQHPLSKGVLPFLTAAVGEMWGWGQREMGRMLVGAEKVGMESVKGAIANGKTPKPIQRTSSSLLADHSPSKILPPSQPKPKTSEKSASSPMTAITPINVTASNISATPTDSDFPALPTDHPIHDGHMTGKVDSYAVVVGDPPVAPGSHLHPAEVDSGHGQSRGVHEGKHENDGGPSYAEVAAE